MFEPACFATDRAIFQSTGLHCSAKSNLSAARHCNSPAAKGCCVVAEMRGAAVATQRAVWMKKHSPSAMSKSSGTCQTFVPRVVAERLKPVTLFSQQADADGAPDGLRWGGIILTSNTSKRRLTGGSRSLECDLLCGVWRTCSHAHFSWQRVAPNGTSPAMQRHWRQMSRRAGKLSTSSPTTGASCTRLRATDTGARCAAGWQRRVLLQHLHLRELDLKIQVSDADQ